MSLINSFKTDDITVTRFSKGVYVKGIFKKGTETNLVVKAVVTPLTGQELLKLSEGRRTREGVKVYTEEPLLNEEDGAGKSPDIICLRGKKYEVQESSPWLFTDLPHYRSLAVKVEQNVESRKVK